MRGVLSALLILALVVSLACGGEAHADRPQPATITVEPLSAFHPPVRTEVEPGDTVETVCRRLAGDGWFAWTEALKGQLDPRRLLPGTVFEGTETPHGCLERLRVVLDQRSELHLEVGDNGVRVERFERDVASEVVRITGTVTSSLFEAVETAGADAILAVRLAEIFQWDVDFFRDLREGDSFVVVVDEQRVDGAFFEWGTIYAARFVNQGKALNAVVYPDTDGRLGYYDFQGHPLQKQFLRSPLKFSRITSRFSSSRFHPILKRAMPHYGVDYGAPVGTPAHSTADGVVTFVGRNGGTGNMVTVRHANGYETNYLHLSRFGPGIRRGVRVGQGQVIGYVGMTGLATGPHLDYRVRLNGRWINPLTISSPPAKPFTGERLTRYLAHALGILELLEGREPPLGARC